MKLRGHDAHRRASSKGPKGSCGSVTPETKPARNASRRRVGDLDQRRGMRMSRGAAEALGPTPIETSRCELSLTSEDRTLVFRLKRIDGHVHMERIRRRARSTAVVQVSNFGDEASFIRWCESDRLRFTFPLLFANLRRSGRALFHPPD